MFGLLAVDVQPVAFQMLDKRLRVRYIYKRLLYKVALCSQDDARRATTTHAVDRGKRGRRLMDTGEQPIQWHEYVDLKVMAKAMGDVVRLNILHALASQNEMIVTDLAQQLLVSQPLISWHLTILRRAGLVRTRRKGRLVYCSLDRERCAEAIRQLGEVVAPPRQTESREVPAPPEPHEEPPATQTAHSELNGAAQRRGP